MKRVIVPFFISHQGCPHDCIFCDQRTISGSSGELPQADELLARIESWRASSGRKPVEVAFYGGTFTALERSRQEALLQPLQPLLAAGSVAAVRVSTRPDTVDTATAEFLRAAGVSLVELGVQSMHDHVLAAAGRGHDAAATAQAFATLRSAGLLVGAQLMPGLPGESPSESLVSLRRVLALGPDVLRIYPALVLEGTALARLYRSGAYRPLTLAAAVDICKIMLQEAAAAGVPVVRVGLQPSEDLALGTTVLAGPFHPALRQLAEAERCYDLLCRLLADSAPGQRLAVSCNPARIADFVGHRRLNIERLRQLPGEFAATITGDASLAPGSVIISDGRRSISGDILRDLTY